MSQNFTKYKMFFSFIFVIFAIKLALNITLIINYELTFVVYQI